MRERDARERWREIKRERVGEIVGERDKERERVGEIVGERDKERER